MVESSVIIVRRWSVRNSPDGKVFAWLVFRNLAFLTTHLTTYCTYRSSFVPSSILDAIKMGIWDFDPEDQEVNDDEQYEPTSSLPGSEEKLAILSERINAGLPLWHPQDRYTYDDSAKIPE